MDGERRVVQGLIAVAALVLTVGLAWAEDTTTGKVTIQTMSAGIGLGITWGDGVLEYHGEKYPFSVTSFDVGDIGVAKMMANGVASISSAWKTSPECSRPWSRVARLADAPGPEPCTTTTKSAWYGPGRIRGSTSALPIPVSTWSSPEKPSSRRRRSARPWGICTFSTPSRRLRSRYRPPGRSR